MEFCLISQCNDTMDGVIKNDMLDFLAACPKCIRGSASYALDCMINNGQGAMHWRKRTNHAKVRCSPREHRKEEKITNNSFSIKRSSKVIAPCE